MSKQKEEKTNVMRILDQKKIPYTPHVYPVGEKSVSMLPAKELLPLTGYVHGGCSPVGMKKRFPTVFHESCLELETIFVSAGKVGCQVEVEPSRLIELVGGTAAELIVEG